jgi:hypothetical protein
MKCVYCLVKILLRVLYTVYTPFAREEMTYGIRCGRGERTTRGLPASTVIFEELASYQDTSGHQSGENVYRALAPSVAQFRDDGRIIAPSTPRGQRGVFFRLYEQALHRKDAYVLHCPTWELNPSICKMGLFKGIKIGPDC